MALWAPALVGPPPQERGQPPTPAVPTAPRAFLVKRGLLRCAGVTEARGPLGPRHRWSLWIIGRWPVLIPRFPGGAAPREPPFVGVSAGSGPPTRGPYAAGHTAPVRAAWWNTLRVDRCLRGYSGGNWMVTFFASPRCAGGLSRWPGARSPLPVYTQVTSWPLSGGSGPPGLGVPTVSVEPAPGVVTKLSG